MAERPQPVGGIAGRAVGDASLAQMAVGGGEAPLDVGWRKRGKGVEEPGPDRVAARRPGRYIRRECRAAARSRASIAPSGAGPDGPCSLTISCRPPSRSEPLLTRFPTRTSTRSSPRQASLESAMYDQCRSGVLKSRVKGTQLCVPPAADRSCRGVAVILKAGQPPRLGLIGIDRLGRRNCGRRDGRHDRRSRRASGRSRCRSDQMSAARGPEWSDAARRPAARP